ncbi:MULTISPECIES: hypothetical protein [unclassified Stenotrophomonas]|uniref:hypothetical protein n=1 Tax=unclassified Stenotrophomonas TaxID=196198 RepID=UPI002118AF54|nr:MULTISPECIES: hypothetical protein [unclassified Stenotrophomonas]
MSILNVLMTPERAVVAVDTLAQDAVTGEMSEGAKLLLIPQHNIVVAARGSGQFFLRVYQLCLEASFRKAFSIEQIMGEVGPVMDQMWPNYVQAIRDANMDLGQLQSEIVVVGWSKAQSRIVGAAYAKSVVEQPTRVAPLIGGIAAPGQPLRDVPDSFHPHAILAAGRRQAEYVNAEEGRHVAGGRLIAAFLERGEATVRDLGDI